MSNAKKKTTPIEKLCGEIIMHGRTAYATSVDVATHFGKRHDNVLRDIENIINPDLKNEGRNANQKAEMEQFSTANFGGRNYIGKDGKEHPLIEMTRDGFSMLVMGFTGPEATMWKIAYITER